MTPLELAAAMLAQARATAEADPDNAQAAMNRAAAEHRVRQERRAAALVAPADGPAAPDPHPGTPEPGETP